MLKTYKDLNVWQKAYQLCLDIYGITAAFPNEEKFAMTSQLRRAAVSIPSNIAEGYGRRTRADYIKFLYIAYGSTCELETQVLLTGDLGYMDGTNSKRLMDNIAEVERMLKGLMNSLEAKPLSP